MIRLVALDLDATLLQPDGSIRPADRAAVRAAVARGARVVIATGRCFANAVDFARALDLDGPMIVTTGGQVVEVASERLLCEHRLPRAVAAEILAFCRERGYPACAYYDLGRDRRWVVPPPASYRWARPVVADARPPEVDPEQLVVVGPEAVRAVAAAFADSGQQILVLPGPERPEAAHVLHPAATKGEALRWLADAWGIAMGEVAAVGDSLNDLSMIAAAGHGYCMVGSPPAVQAVARGVVASVADALAAAGVV